MCLWESSSKHLLGHTGALHLSPLQLVQMRHLAPIAFVSVLLSLLAASLCRTQRRHLRLGALERFAEPVDFVLQARALSLRLPPRSPILRGRALRT